MTPNDTELVWVVAKTPFTNKRTLFEASLAIAMSYHVFAEQEIELIANELPL